MKRKSENKKETVLFLEADAIVDDFWIDRINDTQLFGKIKTFTRCTNLERYQISRLVDDYNVIAFACTMCVTHKSFHMFCEMLDFFMLREIKGKTIVSCMYLLETMNLRYKIKDSHRYARLFEENIIGELHCGDEYSRIQFIDGKYQYTTLLNPETAIK